MGMLTTDVLLMAICRYVFKLSLSAVKWFYVGHSLDISLFNFSSNKCAKKITPTFSHSSEYREQTTTKYILKVGSEHQNTDTLLFKRVKVYILTH